MAGSPCAAASGFEGKTERMASFEQTSFSVEGFSGRARLFPLPNLVLFPHIMQPLHIFEPRYRELLDDALADDGLIALAVLRPGWQADYEGRPPIHSHACLGRVTTHHRLEDGTYNLLVAGMRRVRIVRELPPTRAYRVAEVAVCEDENPPSEAAERAALQRRLHMALRHVFPKLPDASEQLDQLLGGGISLGVLTDLVGFMLDVEPSGKAALLAELNVARRAEMLLEHLASSAALLDAAEGLQPFPPLFSPN